MQRLGISFLLVGILLLSTPASGQEKLENLKSQFEELYEDLLSDQKKFDENYQAQLAALAEKAQQSAQLELLVAVKEESESFRDSVGARRDNYSEYAELAKLQSIYREHSMKLAEDRKRKGLVLASGYRSNLQKLRTDLTQAGKIDEALRVQSELDKVERLVADLSGPGQAPATATVDSSVASILTGRKWLRDAPSGKHIFTFHPDGTSSAASIETSWKSYEVDEENRSVTIQGGDKARVFFLSESRPYKLTSPKERNMSFEEMADR